MTEPQYQPSSNIPSVNASVKFNVGPMQRLFLFICAAFIGLTIASVLMGVITWNGTSPARLRIATVVQDLFMFVLPAVATAFFITRRPADFLLLRRVPGLSKGVLTVCIVLASLPAIEWLVAWNAGLTLPQSMSGIEEWMRQAESQAGEFTSTLIGGHGWSSFIVALLIVGVLAAFSEELFFRGTLQRLFSTAGVNVHIAVWLTAIVFSAIHMQFFGFFPRLVLGALFGYIVAWTGCVWLGMLAHFVNNAIAAWALVFNTPAAGAELAAANAATVIQPDAFLAGGSACMTILLLWLLRRQCQSGLR